MQPGKPVMKLRLSFFLPLLLLAGCIPPPDYPIEPEIEFISVSKTVLNYNGIFGDSLRVVFGFKDGDGDIGFEPYDSTDCNRCSDSCLTHPSLSIFVYDNRTNCLSPFHVPYVPPKGSSDAISGKVDMVISTCCIIDGFVCPPNVPSGVTDTVQYTIQIKDRAGHLSNKIELPPIVINCSRL
jgi:hypothetical protein